MTAVTGRDPGELYRELTREFGEPAYQRIDAQKAILTQLSPRQVTTSELVGEKITSLLTTAPGTTRPSEG
jgi:phosphoglucomutase